MRSAMASVPSSSSAWLPIRLDRQDPYLRVLAVNVFVRDQDRSLRFFVDQLGFHVVVDESYDAAGRWLAVAPPDGATVLALVAPKRNSKDYKKIGHSHDVVFVTEDVIAKYSEWSKRGVRFHHAPQQTLWGGVFTRFEDIDGNTFSLVGRDDFVREVEAQRRAAADKLEKERRTAQELEIAKQVQARLFPQMLPELATLEYAGLCLQAREIGGDYYDFLTLGRGRLGILIGDVSGKGIAAALLMANLQAALRSQSATALDQPHSFLNSVNRLFCENTPDSAYATIFFGEYDDNERMLRYANCGHYAALLLRGENVERLESTCTVMGLFQEWSCRIEERQLTAGDTLVLYTDGVTESRSESGDEFGEDRLIAALQRNARLTPRHMVDAVIDEVRRFSPHEQHDDITVVVAKCR